MKKLLVLALTCLGISMAHAQFNFYAVLDGLQETPPAPTPATGYATLTLNPGGTVSYTITYQNLVAGINNAHIHGPAPIGTPAGVVVGLPGFTAGSTSGTWSGTTAAMSLAQVNDLRNGLHYINIHTPFRPGGEIRGQILVVPEPGTLAIAGLGGLMLCAGIRRHSRK